MRPDTAIIDMYLDGSAEANMSGHWIFHSIKSGERLFEMPPSEKRGEVREIYEWILKCLADFQARNKRLFDSVFPNAGATEDPEIRVYLIVGAPAPYDAMCRVDGSGRLCVIFDIIRILEYCNNFERIHDLMRNLITHELTHIYIHQDYPAPDSSDGFAEKLKYIVFDEGFAHYLSFAENVLEFDFSQYSDKLEAVCRKLKEALRDDTGQNDRALLEANAGNFWDKFGAVAGLFGISEYIAKDAEPCVKIAELYSKGPDFLTDYIIKYAMAVRYDF